MKILLVDIDSTIPNLALKKIEKYYQDKAEIVWGDMPLFATNMDKIFVSCIFPENKYKCNEWELTKAEIGGTGYDIKKRLPQKIERMKPKINWGFTTRGCTRNCKFCVVPEKEGYIHKVGDIYDIWDGKSKNLTIMDNNIFAMPEHFELIYKQLKKENLTVDFNQGLDHRLLTPKMCEMLLDLRHQQEIRFAFDDIHHKPTVLRALKMLKKTGCKDWQTKWYVYVSPEDTIANVYERLTVLREAKQLAYLMRDRKIAKEKKWIGLSQWVNSIWGLFKTPLPEAIEKAETIHRYKKYLQEILSD